MTDGSVVFSTALDNTQLKNDLAGLKNKVEKAGSKSTKAVRFNVDVSEAEKNLRAAMDQMEETGKRIKELQRQVDSFSGDKSGGEFSGLLSLLDQKKAEYRAAELSYHDAFDRVNGRGKYRAAPTEVLDAQEIQKKIDSFAAGASPELNRMRKELEEAENALKALEAKGWWFGDADFDKAYQKLALIKQEIKEYKVELTSPAKPTNPFGLDTLAGKIREAELLMKHLVEKGKGLGDADYNAAYREFALLKAEEAALKKQLATSAAQESDHLREIANSAQVANQHIASLNEELAQLKARQKELEQANVGLGYQEYDQNAARIAEITRGLKEYQKVLNSSGTNQQDAPADRAAQAQKRLNAILEKSSAAYKNISKAIEVVRETAAGLQEASVLAGGNAAQAFQSAGAAAEMLGTKMSAVLSAAAPYLAIAAVAVKMIQAIKTAIDTVIEKAKKAAAAVGRGLQKVVELGKTAVAALTAAADQTVRFLKELNPIPRIAEAIGQKFKRVGSTMKSALVFSVIYKGLSMVRQQMGMYLMANEQFTTALRRLQGVLLTAFQPIYEVIVPAFTTLINILSRAVAAVTQFFASLFGTTAKKAQTNAKALYGEANAIKAAGSAAEEAAGSLAGFDEINTIQTEKGGSGGGAGAGIDTGPLFDWEYDDTPFDSWGEAFSAFLDKLLDGIPKLEEAFKKFADWLNGFSQKLYDMFKFPGVLEKVERLGRDLAGAFNKLVNWIDWNLLGKALGAGLNLALQFLTEFLYAFDWMNLGRKLAEFVNGLASEIDWYDFGRLLWAGFKIALETLAGFIVGLDMPLMAQAASNIIMGFFDEMKNTIQRIPWYKIGSQIAAFLNNINWYDTLTSVIQAIQAALRAMQQLLAGFVDTLHWSDIAAQIYTAINDSFGNINWQHMGQTLGDAFVHVFDFLREVIAGIQWVQIGTDIAAFLNGIDWIKLLSSLAGAIAAGINAAIHTLYGLVSKLDWATIGTAIGNAVNRLVHDIDWAAAGLAFSDGLNGIITAAANALETIDWNAIGEAIETFLSNIDWAALSVNVARLIVDIFGVKLHLAFLKLKVLSEIGEAIINGIKAGVMLAKAKIAAWIKEHIVDPLVNTVKNLLGIHSPSTVFAEIGENLIAGLLQGISNTWNNIIGFFGEKIEGIKGLLSDAWNSIRENASAAWDNIRTTLGTIWDGLKNSAGTIFEGIKTSISNAWENIKTVTSTTWEGIKTTLSTLWDSLKEKATAIFENIKTAISAAWENIKAKTSEIWNNIKTTLGTLWNNLKTTVTNIFNEIKNKVVEVWTTIKNEAAAKWNEITSTIHSKVEEVKSKISSAWETVRSSTTSAWSGIKSTVSSALSDIWSNVSSTFGNIVSAASSWGRDMCDNISNGISRGVGKVKSAVKGVADKISDYLHFSEPDEGPLSNFHTFMPDMLELMAKGIVDNADLAVHAASDLADSIANAVSGKSIGVNMQMPDISKFTLPAVVQGSTIPANREFMTVVQSETSNGSSPQNGLSQEMFREVMGQTSGLLQEILSAVREGKIIAVDGTKFGRTAIAAINSVNMAAGRQMLNL